MGTNKDIGSRFKGGKDASPAGMDLTGADGMPDVRDAMKSYLSGGDKTNDSIPRYGDGMKYVVAHTSEAFWQTDSKFNFTYVNPACEKISGGYTLEDLEGKSLLEFLAPESIEQLRRVNDTRQRDEKLGIQTDVLYHELRMKRKNGTYFWAGISASPIRDAKGHIAGYQGVLKDISSFKKYETEQLRLEGLLKTTQRLAAVGQMTGVVAHEINNVMAGVLGFSELLMMQSDMNDEYSQTYLKNIIGSSERIIAVLQDLMVVSRRDDEVRKALNLNDLILAFLYQPEFQKLTGQQPGVTVNLDLEPSVHDIMASFSKLEKALLNLLSVAFLQAGPEGCVSIATKSIYLGRPVGGDENICEGEYVVLSVSDSGEGISEEDASLIFDPFYVRKAMKPEATGLELTIAREVIKDHQGFIDVRSKIGCGSTFTVYLPVMRNEMKISPALMRQMDGPDGQTGIH